MTITELASRIYKSKATVSKYEQAQIAIDIATLYSIAEVLEVTVKELVDFVPEKPENKPVFEKELLFYMYNISTNASKTLTSVIRILYSNCLKDEVCTATLYYDVPTYDKWQDCDHIYHGTASFSEYITTLHFQNHTWYREHIHILLSTPLKADRVYQGIILGLSETTLLPTANKVVLTSKPLQSLDDIEKVLMFSKEDLQRIKKYNAFSWKKNI